MTSSLLRSTAIILFLACVPAAGARAESDVGGYFDQPTAFVTLEGGYALNASDANARFVPDVDKLGDFHELDPLHPGNDGWHGKAEIGQSISADWDFKVSLSALVLGIDASDSGFASSAKQDFGLHTLDVELGYHPNSLGPVDARIFAGLRGLRSQTDMVMVSKLGSGGSVSDRVTAAGPRLGLDISVPLNESSVALVGSVSGAILLGGIDTDIASGPTEYHDSDRKAVWNVEGMAGLSVDIGEGANLTLGYRAAEFGGLVNDRSDIDKLGSFSDNGTSDVIVHGPFARMTVELH
jgi:hypothetical protein